MPIVVDVLSMKWLRHDLNCADLVEPSNAHPASFGNVTVGAEFLNYKGTDYPVTAVTNISFEWTKVVRPGAGIHQSMELRFRLPNVAKRICLETSTVSPIVVFHPLRSIGVKHETLLRIHLHLSRQSFDARFLEYNSKLDQCGSLLFNDCHLMVDGRVIQKIIALRITDPAVKVINTLSHLSFLKTGKTEASGWRRVLGTRSDQVHLDHTIDCDVIHALLECRFGLQIPPRCDTNL